MARHSSVTAAADRAVRTGSKVTSHLRTFGPGGRRRAGARRLRVGRGVTTTTAGLLAS